MVDSVKRLIMPMGQAGSPNTIQSLMEHVVSGITWKTCLPFLDDCIISSKTAEDNISRLRAFFPRFRDANLKINPSNRSFFQTVLEFLQHIVSKNGLQVNSDKIKAVPEFPTHKSQTQVKSFFRLSIILQTLCSRFCFHFRPLTRG